MYNPLIMPVGMPVAAAGIDPSRPGPAAQFDSQRAVVVVDGTPFRVVLIAGAGALALVALRWAGFRFNVGVSS